jgi:hypothetical protein
VQHFHYWQSRRFLAKGFSSGHRGISDCSPDTAAAGTVGLPLFLLWVDDGGERVRGGCACATVILVVIDVWLQCVGAGRHGFPPNLRHRDEISVG